MESLNFNHLKYFWTVAREGTIAAASERLYLTQSTISTQIRALEKYLGARLFDRVGRNLVLTKTGQVVYRYAGEIFALGDELVGTVRGSPGGPPARLSIGAQDTLPKLIVRRLLEPVFHLPQPVKVICHEGTPLQLLPKLSTHEVDLVLSDAPMQPQVRVRAFSHLLGECGVAFFALPDLAGELRKGFPKSLSGAPVLLPAETTAMRGTLERWFHAMGVHPTVVAESEDVELIMALGQQGRGFFPAHDVIAPEIAKNWQVELIGEIGGLTERFYAISVERRLNHPAVVAITETARTKLFVH
ncbi:MAG: LysR family transcriptional regulator [Phycisphaerae bacterium]